MGNKAAAPTIHVLFVLMGLTFCSCNSNGNKDSIEKADSANQAIRDTGINQKNIVIDEGSSAFLVRVANENMAEVDLAALATQKSMFPPVKSFGSKLLHDHSLIHDQVLALAAQKNIVLPETISEERQKEIEAMKTKSNAQFDRAYLDDLIKRHEQAISMFEKALTEVKDPDINSLADKTLMQLRHHLDSARVLQKGLRN